MTCNTDLETWLHDFGERIYRILEYRKPGLFTPYEMENKFSDESLYMCNEYKKVIIEEVIELPNKDLLIGFCEVFPEDDGEYEISDSIEYLKLSEIKLECFACDQQDKNLDGNLVYTDSLFTIKRPYFRSCKSRHTIERAG